MQVLKPVSAQPAVWCGMVAWHGGVWEGCPCKARASSPSPCFSWHLWDFFLPQGRQGLLAREISPTEHLAGILPERYPLSLSVYSPQGSWLLAQMCEMVPLRFGQGCFPAIPPMPSWREVNCPFEVPFLMIKLDLYIEFLPL